MSGKTFQHQHRVTYADCTVGNHVYYGHYLGLLEAARGEFFRSLGRTFLEWQEQDTIFPALEVHLRFQGPARYDDLLTISIWLAEMRGVRINFTYQVTNQTGVLLVEGETWHVCTSTSDKPKRLPKELVTMLEPFQVSTFPKAQVTN